MPQGIARVGLQQAVRFRPAVHERLAALWSRQPLAARAVRSLRRASNIILQIALQFEPSLTTSASSGTPLTTIATKISLPRDQLGVHGAAQRGKQIPSLGLPGRLETEPARQPVQVLGVQRTSGRRQKCCPIWADTSRMTNL